MLRARHRWDYERERRLAGSEFSDGCGRNVRACVHCGTQKITVIPPQSPPWPWHEWIKDGKAWRGEVTPPCVRQNVEPIAALEGGL